MNKKKTGVKRLLYIYISILLTLFTFFTIYAFRFDILSILEKNDFISFSIPKEKEERIKDKLEPIEFNTKNLNNIMTFLHDELEEYHIQTEAYLPYEFEDSLLYYGWGEPVHYQSYDYEESILLEKNEFDIMLHIYPTFTSYFKTYSLITLLISILLGFLFYVGLKKNLFTKLGKRILSHIPIPKWTWLHNLTAKLILANLLSFIIASGLFAYAYKNSYSVFEFMMDNIYYKENFNSEVSSFSDHVKDIELHNSNKKEIKNQLKKLTTNHSQVFLYKENGKYFTESTSNLFYDNDFPYQVNVVSRPVVSRYIIPFENQFAQLFIYSYPLIALSTPILFLFFIMAFSVYLIVLLGFVSSKVKVLQGMQTDINELANGNWNHEVTTKGNDEISDLGEHLNHLRISFMENMENEKEARNANKNLISAISHDVRTPLTTLQGYLEIIQMNKVDKNKQKEYVDRCLNKVDELREISNKMFEYALVFSTEDSTDLSLISIQEIKKLLEDHIQYLRLQGYITQFELIESNQNIFGNEVLLKRIFNNLFSNIQKYGDKQKPSNIMMSIDKNILKLSFMNSKNQNIANVESNGIGLKSVQKMMQIHHGNSFVNDCSSSFAIVLEFPLSTNN